MTHDKESNIREDGLFSKLLTAVFVAFISLAPATTIGYYQYQHHFGNSKAEINADHKPAKSDSKH